MLALLVSRDEAASRLLSVFEPVPRVSANVGHVRGENPLEREAVQAAIKDAEDSLFQPRRLLVRRSGTEPVVRILAEGRKREADAAVATVREAIET